jgi:hypothetical protein
LKVCDVAKENWEEIQLVNADDVNSKIMAMLQPRNSKTTLVLGVSISVQALQGEVGEAEPRDQTGRRGSQL